MVRNVARTALRSRLRLALRRNPAALLLGPRQCGKTTLARELVDLASPNYFDLEDPLHLARLDQPMTALEPLRGTVVIDEVQRRPDLFPMLRVLLDRPGRSTRFLLLGSASLDLLKQSSESLAGRVGLVGMAGFGIDETGAKGLERLWLRGGLPRSFLAGDEAASWAWRADYIRLLLERDVPQFGVRIPATALHRFWSMVAHTHGSIWSNSEPARSLGVAETTIRRYLDVMVGLLMVRQLQPWHENLGKRQVKAPKVFVRDSGLLHQLLGVKDMAGLLRHPRMGASWEGLALEEVLRCVAPEAEYFWATHAGAELDLLLFKDGKRLGVEFKHADAPAVTKSMRIAQDDLGLDALAVVYPGTRRFAIAEDIEAVPLRGLARGGPEVLFPRLFRAPRGKRRPTRGKK
ncbi:MAG: ATP-binding protein [Planctomycetes bacterium]|nr:ATP-binding protein [Planctomycetota bacterium]